jgi:hypothetical protein
MASSQQRQSLVISAATSGDNTLLAAVSGYKIRVLSYKLVSAGSVTTRFESGAGGTALTGVMSQIVGVPNDGAFEKEGLFETAASALLNLELSGAVQVSGHLTYCLVAG